MSEGMEPGTAGGSSDESFDPSLDEAVYTELKRIARHHLRTRASGATLSTTDLVHEAYLKFGGANDREWSGRAHFFGSASRAMRQVLVDYARSHGAAKRGGGVAAVTLTGSDVALAVQFDELLVLDEALDRLRELNERLCRVVELRFFAGLGDEEIAELLGVTTRTVGRDWVKAKLYLSKELGRD
jgi:RNA polymerase sigma factor (TIGR02999 family)